MSTPDISGSSPGPGVIPPVSNGEKADRWILGVNRRYRTVFVHEFPFTVYPPASFSWVETYKYGADGLIHPVPTTR